jgi:hypothetical protein
MPWIIDKIRDILPNRPYGKTAKDFRVARLIDINRVIESINTSFDGVETAISNIPAGPQGPIGPQGIAGPVGPAGLNWQGLWSASNSYVVDDAVGYNGASWFCINNVGPSVTTPDLDPTNWALLAAQGAQGPQGPQGIQGPVGSIAPYTNAAVFATSSSTGTVMTADINAIVAGTNNWNVRLPQGAPAGKEIFVYGSMSIGNGWTNVQAYNLGTTIITDKSNQSTGQFQVYFADIVRFTSAGNDFWIAENITSSPLRFNDNLVNSPGAGNRIYESTVNSTTSPLSAASLNSTYNVTFYKPGFKVICPSISGGGLMYIRTTSVNWVSVPLTTVI